MFEQIPGEKYVYRTLMLLIGFTAPAISFAFSGREDNAFRRMIVLREN